jgi:hypothetical protein
MSDDKVNSPSHYTTGTIESLVYIESMLTEEEYIGFLRGNISKYLHRYKYKNGVEDLRKAQFYLNKLIDKTE